MELPVDRRRRSLVPFVILVAIAAVYISTPVDNHTEAEDSLHYLTMIERGSATDLFSRDHLVYLALNRGFLDAWRVFGYSGTAELPARALNILAGIVALAVLLALLRALDVSLYLRVLCVSAVAFSYAYWLYAGQCETYVMPIVFILGSIYYLIKAFEKPSVMSNHIWIGVLSAVAILLHRQHSLVAAVIVVAYLLMFARRRTVMKPAMLIRALAAYGGVCGGIVLASYTAVGVFIYRFDSFGAMTEWLFRHAYFGVGKIGLSTPAAAAAGLSRAILSTHYLFAFPQMVSRFQQMFPTQNLREEIFLVRAFPQWLSIMLAALTAVFMLSLVVALIEVVRGRSFRVLYSTKCGSPRSVYCCAVAVIYVLVYSIFNMWWEPVNPEFWISVLPVLGILSALVTSSIFNRMALRAAMTLAAVLILAINLASGILPQRNPENDYWRIVTRWYVDNAGEGDLVVTGGGRLTRSYIKYYSGADAFGTAIPLPEEEIWSRYRETVERVGPARILVSSTVLTPNPRYLRQFKADGSASAAVFERMRPYLQVLHSDSVETIYLYSGPGR